MPQELDALREYVYVPGVVGVPLRVLALMESPGAGLIGVMVRVGVRELVAVRV